MVDIPVELFLGFTAIAVIFAVSGLVKRIPIMIFIGGVFMLSLFIATDVIIMGTREGHQDIVIYEVTSPAVANNINSVASTIQAEYPSSSSSQLYGDTFDCMRIPLAKTGAPPAGNLVRVGVWGATGNLIQQFGQSLDVQNMPAGLTTYEFCLPEGQTYKIGTFPLVERIGAEYNYADAVNFITARSDNANPFDGTTTFRQQVLAGVWSSSTGQDLNMKLWLRGVNAQNIEFEFTEFVKMIYALFASILMLVGWLVYKTN